jgi:hypothetical protein
VSVNGGWNLLIGTNPAGRGGWAPLETPEACRTVFDEAAKDLCFARAARERIAEAPRRWLGLADDKLAVTFDYAGAAGWYLHAANPEAFGERAKVVLGAVETLYERVALLLALAFCLPGRRARRRWASWSVVVVGALLCMTRWGWLAHGALLAALALRPPGLWRAPALVGGSFAVLLSVAAVHAVFFGAGRYQLPVVIFVTALAPLGLSRLRQRMVRRRRSSRPSR